MDRVPANPDFVAESLQLFGLPACACNAAGQVFAVNAELARLIGRDASGLELPELFTARAAPEAAARLHSATPDAKAVYFGVLNQMSQVGKVAMVTLLVTGPLMLWLRYGGLGGANAWFWVKMVLIVVLIVAIVVGDINFKKEQAGDMAAAKMADLAHKISGLAFAGVLLAAVLAFN